MAKVKQYPYEIEPGYDDVFEVSVFEPDFDGKKYRALVEVAFEGSSGGQFRVTFDKSGRLVWSRMEAGMRDAIHAFRDTPAAQREAFREIKRYL